MLNLTVCDMLSATVSSEQVNTPGSQCGLLMASAKSVIW